MSLTEAGRLFECVSQLQNGEVFVGAADGFERSYYTGVTRRTTFLAVPHRHRGHVAAAAPETSAATASRYGWSLKNWSPSRPGFPLDALLIS